MKLAVITAPDFISGEEDIINSLFENGLDYLHLRKPECNEKDLRKILDGIHPEFYQRTVLHEHFILSKTYPVGGIHLNRRNGSIPFGFKGKISESCHSLKEVEIKKEGRDYLFLSPIFNSISKKGYNSNFSSETLSEASSKGIIDKKVFALGGIEKNNIRFIRDLGFGGAAVLGYLWNLPHGSRISDYLRTFESLSEECR